MSESENSGEGLRTAPDRRRRKDQPVAENPDVHLDAPQLKLDEVKLNLLKILEVEIKGLDAELLLDVDLENLVGLLNRVVDTLGETLGDDKGAVRSLIEAGTKRLAQNNGGGSANEEGTLGQALDAAKRALMPSEEASDGSPEDHSDGSSSDDEANQQTHNVRYAVNETGDIIQTTLNDAGEVLDEEILGHVSDLRAERE